MVGNLSQQIEANAEELSSPCACNAAGGFMFLQMACTGNTCEHT